jgi:hypothetical protein
MLARRIGAVFGACLLLTGTAAAASDYDQRYGYSTHYGVVTPRDVVALANNFNAVLDYYFETHGAGRVDAARNLTPEVVSGKSSEDLLARSLRLADLVDQLGQGSHLPPVLRIDRAGETALPAESYLQVGASLDGLIFYLSALDASQIWGDYYVTLRYPDEKTPDDAYAAIDLAVRKLELATSAKADGATTGENQKPVPAPGGPTAAAPTTGPQTAAGA